MLFFAGLFLGLDQYTKYLADSLLKNQADFEVLSGIISFSYVENTGMAWGMLSGKIGFFVVMTIMLLAAIFFTIYRIEVSKVQQKVFFWLEMDFLLLAAGAAGNLIDRVFHGYVIDFIKTEFIDFPVFNLADCYVTVACAGFVVLLLFFISEEDFNSIF